MSKLLTIIIPAYNGEPYLEHSLHSIINERIIEEGLTDHFEVIVIDDGSKDNTTKLAKEISSRWDEVLGKNFIKVITKPNGQYGSVINRGLKEAKGTYVKVLDVDDTFNTASFIKLMYIMLGFENLPEVIYTDHTFEKVGTDDKILQSLRKTFEPNKLLKIKDTPFPKDLITMHSVIYRTDLLIKNGYKQIEGVYYSDSQYSLQPLLWAKTMYYIELPLYRYYIGRNEQSINLKVMVKNRSHQTAVMHKIFEDIEIKKKNPDTIKKYTFNVMTQMIQWNTLLIASDNSIESKRKTLISLLDEMAKKQPKYKKKIVKGIYIRIIKLTRGFMIPTIVKISIKIYSKFKKNILAEWD